MTKDINMRIKAKGSGLMHVEDYRRDRVLDDIDLLATGYDGSQPLVNPMCGSGTIAIEAALLATGRPPGLLRSVLHGRDAALERLVGEKRVEDDVVEGR